MASVPPITCTTRTGKAFIIRAATPNDAAALLECVSAITGECPYLVMQPDELPPTAEAEGQWIASHLEKLDDLILVAEAEGEIVASISFESGLRRRIAHRGLFGLAVLKAWRGKGVGTALLKAMLDWAEANPQIEKVCLEVFADNTAAIRLYEKFGFSVEGVRPKDVKLAPHQYADSVAMYRFVK